MNFHLCLCRLSNSKMMERTWINRVPQRDHVFQYLKRCTIDYISLTVVFASRTLVVSMWLMRWVAMRNSFDVTIPPLSSWLSGLFVSRSWVLGSVLLSCSRVLEGKAWVFWTRLVCRAIECLALPCLPSSREFRVAVERAFECLSPPCLVFSLQFCVAFLRDSECLSLLWYPEL